MALIHLTPTIDEVLALRLPIHIGVGLQTTPGGAAGAAGAAEQASYRASRAAEYNPTTLEIVLSLLYCRCCRCCRPTAHCPPTVRPPFSGLWRATCGVWLASFAGSSCSGPSGMVGFDIIFPPRSATQARTARTDK